MLLLFIHFDRFWSIKNGIEKTGSLHHKTQKSQVGGFFVDTQNWKGIWEVLWQMIKSFIHHFVYNLLHCHYSNIPYFIGICWITEMTLRFPLPLSGVLLLVRKSLCVMSNTEHYRLNQLLCLCLLFNSIVCFDCTTDIWLMLCVKAQSPSKLMRIN